MSTLTVEVYKRCDGMFIATVTNYTRSPIWEFDKRVEVVYRTEHYHESEQALDEAIGFVERAGYTLKLVEGITELPHNQRMMPTENTYRGEERVNNKRYKLHQKLNPDRDEKYYL